LPTLVVTGYETVAGYEALWLFNLFADQQMENPHNSIVRLKRLRCS
jgi:hypothetical protein